MKHPYRIIRHTTCPDPDASGREGNDYSENNMKRVNHSNSGCSMSP